MSKHLLMTFGYIFSVRLVDVVKCHTHPFIIIASINLSNLQLARVHIQIEQRVPARMIVALGHNKLLLERAFESIRVVVILFQTDNLPPSNSKTAFNHSISVSYGLSQPSFCIDFARYSIYLYCDCMPFNISVL
jgi:hypothetical protein